MPSPAKPSNRPEPLRPARPSFLSATHVVRPASEGDVDRILGLIAPNVASGAMLPRTREQISADLPSYVVVEDESGRVQACAALYEYSPALAEVGSVAVAANARRQGLGSLAVRGAEALARRRGVDELFALSGAQGFFESLGYRRTSLARYPEKLARYADLRARGVEIVPKTCYRRRTAS